MNRPDNIVIAILLSFMVMPLAAAQIDPGSEAPEVERVREVERVPEVERLRERQQQLLAETKELQQQARHSLEKVSQVEAEQRTAQSEELDSMREELSRTHRQLRELSREVAQAHRQLERDQGHSMHVRLINVGDRPILGIVLGDETQDGVELIGISPDGPAERAGLKQGDILVSIAGRELMGNSEHGGRDALIEVMDEVSPGEELLVEVLRDGEAWKYTVTPEQREPRSWQSVLRLPDLAPNAPGAPTVIVENLVIPEFDEAELASRIEEIEQQAEKFEFIFREDNGEFAELMGDWEIETEAFSHIGGHAMREAKVWFGLPLNHGLELATLNPALGKYFNTDRGVLVIEARQDNAYGLKAGDVIMSISGDDIDSPADLLRALRDAEPGTDIELRIKRDGVDQVLQTKVSENHLSLMQPHAPAHQPAPPVTRH